MKTFNKNTPLVSIITINYNQSKVTNELIHTLHQISYSNYEIIVVDNNSPNDTPQIIKENHPDVKLILSDTNLGFAGGNNLGVQQAKGKYLLFINNDTEVPSYFLEPLVNLLENDSSIGMVSPLIKFHWDPSLIQYAGFTKMSPYTIRNSSIGYHQKDQGQFTKPTQTNAAHGAAMMVPRKVIETVGMMTEVYFLYYEEHDWAEMIKKAGYKIYLQPQSQILHKESISTGKNSPLKTYYLTRNRLIFARRNLHGFTKLISLLFQVLISWPKNLLSYILKGEFENIKAYNKGVIWNFIHYKGINDNPKLDIL